MIGKLLVISKDYVRLTLSGGANLLKRSKS